MAFAALAAGLAIYAIADTVELLVAGTVLIALGCGLLHPGLLALSTAHAREHSAGRAVASFYLGFDLGIGFGAWLLAAPLQWWGLTGVYLGAAALAALGAASLLRSAVQR